MAEVDQISKEPGEPFVKIRATPMAELNRSRLVLVVFSPDQDDATDDVESSPEGSDAGSSEQDGVR